MAGPVHLSPHAIVRFAHGLDTHGPFPNTANAPWPRADAPEHAISLSRSYCVLDGILYPGKVQESRVYHDMCQCLFNSDSLGKCDNARALVIQMSDPCTLSFSRYGL